MGELGLHITRIDHGIPTMRLATLWKFALAVCLLTPQLASADVKLPSIFSNHMVVQRGKPVVIWGWADPGEKITIEFSGEIGEGDSGVAFTGQAGVKADEKGNWSTKLPKQKAGTRCQLSIKGKSNTVTLKDILVGEVWVCSGQSNMEWSVARSINAKEEIANAKHPQIRLFNTPRSPAGTPQKDVKGKWEVCTPKTIPNFSAVAYFFGRHLHKELKVPVGVIETSWGGTRIEPWTPPVGFASVKATKPILEKVKSAQKKFEETKQKRHPLANRGAPTGLYNGMVAPIKPIAIRGAIWYQGESNRGDGLAYEQKMNALINGWRKVWNQGDFPFYYVQLAPYRYGGDEMLLPKIWEAQTNVLKMKNTGMAVTVDIGNVRDIHPKNKQDVGKRLALWALAKDYGKKDLVYSGPLYKSHKVEGKTIRVEFDHVGDGLVSRDGKPLSWFEIAGKDGKFVKAKATIDGQSVVVSSDQVENPQHVRLGWHQLAEPNLSNKNGLPASPFRTNRGK